MRLQLTGVAAVAMAALAAGVAGCAKGPLRVAVPEAPLPAEEGSPAFLDRMSSQRNVSENDALRGMLLLLDDADKAKTFRQRVDALAGRGVADRRWRFDAQRPLTKGRLAYMVCQACKIRGGVLMRLFGPSERYCLRELQYQRIMCPGVWYTPVSGMEFVAVLTRAAEHLQTGEVPEIILSTEGR